MLDRLQPVQFDRLATSGRTKPGRVTCEAVDGAIVEVVVKLSQRCDRGVSSLAMEAIGACLAGDLGLPIPQPYVVELDAEWIDTIPDAAWAASARQSSPAAFGSTVISNGFAPWITNTPIVGQTTDLAAAIFLFDAVIDNPDRRDGNPNCLMRGDDLRIIDHELAFPDTALLIGWRPPWALGALQHLTNPGAHIFRELLSRREVEWEPIEASWQGLSDARLNEYGAALPHEWVDARPAVHAALDKVRNVRDHIAECVAEVRRVLS